MEHFNVTFLLTNATKNGRWVGYTFPQKPKSFKFLSISEENCGADIINGTFKCKIFEFCCQMLQKRGRWVLYTFPQKLLSFKRFSILEENCNADIINVAFKCRTFVVQYCQNGLWVGNTFLQKLLSFKRFSILEENCGADINNRRIKCKCLLANAARTVFGWVILSCKSQILSSF